MAATDRTHQEVVAKAYISTRTKVVIHMQETNRDASNDVLANMASATIS